MPTPGPSIMPRPPAEGPRRLAAFLLPLFFLAAAAYYPALKAGYTNWDDPVYTFENPLVRDFSAAGVKIAFSSSPDANYHPLTDINLAAESAVFGESAAVHHAGNLLLHSLNAVLLFFLVMALAGEPWAAFCAALLWAVHPVQAESVCWLAERKNLLYSFFYLAAILCYLRHLRSRSGLMLAAVCVLFLAALLSKASAVTLPLVLLLLDIYLKNPFTRRLAAERAAFFLAAGVFAAVSAAAQGKNGNIIPVNPFPLLSFYLLKVIWPFALSALYPYTETARSLARHPVLYLTPAAVFAAALWAALKKDRLAAFGLFFFLLNLMPFLILLPVGPSLAADRYLYMPLAGLAVAAAAVAARVNVRSVGKMAALAALAVCLLLSKASASRSVVWSSSRSLWRNVLGRYPGNEVAMLNLADAELAAGDPAEAEALLFAILRSGAGNQKAIYDLGTLYGMTGRYAAAEYLLKRSLALKPDDARAWNNLGLAQLKLGRAAEARKAFLVSTTADPGYAPACANLLEAEKALGGTRKPKPARP